MLKKPLFISYLIGFLIALFFPGIVCAQDSGVVNANLEPWYLSSTAYNEEFKTYDEKYRVDWNSVSVPSTYSGADQEAMKGWDPNKFWEPNSNPENLSIEFTFPNVEEFSRMVYGSRLNGNLKGFATKYSLWTSQDSTGENWTKVAQGTGKVTDQLCCADFGKSISARRVRFIFEESYNNYPSCRQMRFYKADPKEKIIESINSEWKDFTHTGFKDNTDLNKIKENVQSLKDEPWFEYTYKTYADRVEKVLNNEITYNPKLLRSNEANTAEENRSSFAFPRVGNVVQYSDEVLKIGSGVTNRWVTGIWYPSLTTIRIWVHAENPNDKLPLVRWCQPYGQAYSWCSGEIQLNEGENILTVPNYKNANYKTYDIVAGCAAYIVNPYTEKEQTGQVDVYFEDGRTFPVYHLGDDVDAYMSELREHADRVRQDQTQEMDCTELVCDHVFMTVQATRADELYGANGHDPEKNLQVWNDTLSKCIEFDGIPLDPKDPNYDIRNKYLNENYRVCQVIETAFMFTGGEQIGLYGDSQNALIDCLDQYGNSNLDTNWGLIHEWGHSQDNSARVIAETLNNMFPYYLTTFHPSFTRNLEDIDRANRMAVSSYENGTMFAENRNNFMTFWLLESYWPGFWGKFENVYRQYMGKADYGYNDNGSDKLKKTERMVINASVASGYDLRYWFDKWGLNADKEDPVFDTEKTTETFNEVFEKYQREGKIKDKLDGFDKDYQIPIWLCDREEYNIVKSVGYDRNKLRIYHENDKPEIQNITLGKKEKEEKLENGQSKFTDIDVANIIINKNPDQYHLVYLVEAKNTSDDNWQVIGTSYNGLFSDDRFTDNPENYKSQEYRIKAVDRSLHESGYSDVKSYTDQPIVAKVSYQALVPSIDKETFLNNGMDAWLVKHLNEATNVEWSNETIDLDCYSLAEAVSHAGKDKPITLLNDCSGEGINVTKEVTLIPDKGKHITISRTGEDSIFNLVSTTSEGTSLEIKNDESGGGTITLDGYNMASTKPAIALNAKEAVFKADGITFKNFVNINTGSSRLNKTGNGTVFNVNARESSLILNNCRFENNSTKLNGGAIYNEGTATIENCEFENNFAAAYGGAVYDSGSGTSFLENCKFKNNETYQYGGALYSQHTSIINDCDFINNESNYGGAVAVDSSSGQILISGDQPTVFENNTAVEGDAIYSSGNSKIYLANADIRENKDESTVTLESGNLYTNATLDEVKKVNSNIESLKDGEGTAVSDWFNKGSNTKINGIISEYNSGLITAVSAWPEGEHEYKINDKGRNLPVLGTANFTPQENEIKTHVVLANNNELGLKYEADNTLPGIYLQRGGKISFVLNGGEFVKNPGRADESYYTEPEIDGYTAGVKTYLPTNLKRKGYSFVGWFDNEGLNGSSIKYVDEKQNGDITYYAKWASGKYWINYIANGGSMPADAQTHRSMDEMVQLVNPIRSDYEFLGWYTDSGFKNGPVTNVPEGYEGTFTVYAKYDHHRDNGTLVSEIPATCTKAGEAVYEYHCVDCDKPMGTEVKETKAKDHKWSDWSESEGETCDNKKVLKRTCENCGAVETQNTSSDSSVHDWIQEQEKSKQPTCTTDGINVYKCSKCPAERTESVKAIDHHFDEINVDKKVLSTADCTLPGITEVKKRCTICGIEITSSEKTEPTGHVWKTEADYKTDEEALKSDVGVNPQDGWIVESPRDVEKLVGTIYKRECKICGFVERKQDAFEHTWTTEPEIVEEATCTTAGKKAYKCTECGALKDIEEIPRLDHDFTDTTLKTCSRCEEPNPFWVDPAPVEPEEQPDPGHEHTWSESWGYSPAPTCTTGGIEYQFCTQPGCHEKNEETKKIVSELGHDFGTDGNSQYCSRCNVENEHYKPEHICQEGEWVTYKEATCTEPGLKHVKCTICGKELESEVINPLGHEYDENGKCIRCDEQNPEWKNPDEQKEPDQSVTDPGITVDPNLDEEDQPSPGLPSDEDDNNVDSGTSDENSHPGDHILEKLVVQEPTCIDSGSIKIQCTVCGTTVGYETISPKGHDYGDNLSECKNCGTTNPDYKKPCEHEPDVETIEVQATCTTEGIDDITCKKCGAVLERKTLPALGHDFGLSNNEPTCLRPGCNGGNPDYKIDKDPEHIHSYEPTFTVDVEPTCLLNGSKSKHCSLWACPSTIEKTTIPALGHEFVNGICIRCGLTENATTVPEQPGSPDEPIDPNIPKTVTHTISASAEPVKGGTIAGTGTYNYGTPVNLHATANEGYEFENWTLNGVIISTSIDLNVTADNDLNYVAHFRTKVGSPVAPKPEEPDDAKEEISDFNFNTDTVYLTTTQDNKTKEELSVITDPADYNGAVSWIVGQPEIVMLEGSGKNVTLTAKNDGIAVITASIGNISKTIKVIVSSTSIITDGIEVKEPDTDHIQIVAKNVRDNPALTDQANVAEVSIFGWSDSNQVDINAKLAQRIGTDNDWAVTFPINDNGIFNYFEDAGNIHIHIYAQTEGSGNEQFIGSSVYSWGDNGTDNLKATGYAQNIGFIAPSVGTNELIGTVGEARQLEGIRLATTIEGVDLVYSVHAADIGWMEETEEGEYAGTMHQNRRLEAVKIRLTGENAENYKLEVRAHVADKGWLPAVGENEIAGTTGEARSLEALLIKIEPR